MSDIEIDVLGDYEELLRADLSEEGTVTAEDDLHSLLRKAINFHARRVAAQKWEVVFSKELKDRALSEETTTAITAFQKEAEDGGDLTPRLSRLTKKVDYNDLLINDWGFHHFHLGKTLEDDGYMERTDDLLFVVTRNTTMYLIDVLPHKGSFGALALMEIVHRNWPTLLAPYKANILSLETIPTDEMIVDARKSGLMVFVQLKDGTVYAPPGGGITTARTNPMHTLQADRLVRGLRTMEQEIRSPETLARFRGLMDAAGLACPDTLRLKLIKVTHPTFLFEEETTSYQFSFDYSD